MSNYYDFRKCTVCRSDKIRKEYSGDYGVTMLLNTMYLAVMQQLEKPEDSGITASGLIPKIREFGCEIDMYENEFCAKRIMKCLRNGLAHFNIIVMPDPYGKIEHIIIYAQKHDKEKCKTGSFTCMAYDTKKSVTIENIICLFNFTVEALKKTTDYIIDKVLERESEQCLRCDIMNKSAVSENEKNNQSEVKEMIKDGCLDF